MNIAIIGGDLRQIKLAELLDADGGCVRVYGINPGICPRRLISEANVRLSGDDDIIILPMPVSHDGVHINAPFASAAISLNDILAQINVHSTVFGGKLPKEFADALYSKGIAAFDYAENEELMIKNAIPTAEGAVALAINETPVTVWKSKCLVTGWGRCAKALSRILSAMGADVTVAARRGSAKAEIQTLGMNAVDIAHIVYTMHEYDIIFNTVPVKIFTKPLLEDVKKDAVMIDIASKPGGIDFDAAKSLGVRVIWALSLPGRIAPITSGEIIKDTISGMIGGGNCGIKK